MGFKSGTPREKRDALVGVCAVTGSASGIGQKVAQKLCDASDIVIGVDIKQADIAADLSATLTVPNAPSVALSQAVQTHLCVGPTIAFNLMGRPVAFLRSWDRAEVITHTGREQI
jgi:hypothetical protein